MQIWWKSSPFAEKLETIVRALAWRVMVNSSAYLVAGCSVAQNEESALASGNIFITSTPGAPPSPPRTPLTTSLKTASPQALQSLSGQTGGGPAASAWELPGGASR